jgi:ATP-dependent helicase HrpB
LPTLTHDLKQFIARVNLLNRRLPELDFPAYDREALERSLGRAFAGMSLAKEAQAADLKSSIHRHLAPEQIAWLDELAPQSIAWPGEKKVKLLYSENAEGEFPELQVKLHECFDAKNHPLVGEGRIAVKVWLCAPDGKRLQSTLDWPDFRIREYPKIKATLIKKYPGLNWR